MFSAWVVRLRYHPQFQPAGANANFAAILDPHHLAIRTYERGVEAETLACGTGSIASVLDRSREETGELSRGSADSEAGKP